jgi:TatD DNase family protein
VLARAREAGIERILVPGWDLASSEAAVALADRHAPLIQAAVGVHPHHAAEVADSDWMQLERLMADARCSAVGEIGLDFHRNLSPPEAQRAAMRRQLDVAARLGKPVIVHDREAHAEITQLLVGWTGRANAVRGMLHAYSGSLEMASMLTASGYLVSFALPVAFRSAAGPRAAAASLADGTYLVETDAPYLGPDREARNDPTTVLRVTDELARIRSSSPKEIARHARAAYDRLIAR